MLVLKGITCVDNCKEKKRKNIKTTYKKCVCVCVCRRVQKSKENQISEHAISAAFRSTCDYILKARAKKTKKRENMIAYL